MTAWVYASVGLGGGTAYLSIMSFWNSDPTVLRPVAWSLNVAACSVGFLNFRRHGHFDARLAWPFLVGGFLGAAVGGGIQLETRTFQAMLAVTLISVSARMLFASHAADAHARKRPPILPSLLLGLAVGVVSGLVGIGGGIVLGPVLIALGWVDMKTLAPITSLYILLNSSAALSCFLLTGGTIDLPRTGVLCVAVVAGGYFGSRWGAEKASDRTLRRVFGLVALAAGVNLSCKFFGLMGG
ncbi:MAG: hypothetical protein A2V70_09150 [Planctomycetes bacterium RBG_13_63_9]|nr:MAG: hypothetical protein A2V70_09150 [Planctomycetes bacterium RBG_13_63_9]